MERAVRVLANLMAIPWWSPRTSRVSFWGRTATREAVRVHLGWARRCGAGRSARGRVDSMAAFGGHVQLEPPDELVTDWETARPSGRSCPPRHRWRSAPIPSGVLQRFSLHCAARTSGGFRSFERRFGQDPWRCTRSIGRGAGEHPSAMQLFAGARFHVCVGAPREDGRVNLLPSLPEWVQILQSVLLRGTSPLWLTER